MFLDAFDEGTERATPNQMWQTDIFTFRLRGRYAYLIAFVDDYSRFIVGADLFRSPPAAAVIEVYRVAVGEFQPPLFLKRDHGSPFNHHVVDQLLARCGVLPLNNPPHFPRYNGAMEKGIRDFKAALVQRSLAASPVPTDFTLAVQLTAHQLNHQPRRGLNGRCACAVFHDAAQRRRWTLRQRQSIFRLLLYQFGVMSGSPTKLWAQIEIGCTAMSKQNQELTPLRGFPEIAPGPRRL